MAFNIAILISGNGSNMLEIIKAYKDGQINSKVIAVISNNPIAKGIKKAKTQGIITKIINHNEFDNLKDFEESLSDYLEKKKINLVCLAGFMKVLSRDFTIKWNKKILNIHPSLLPSFKGLNTHKGLLKKM